MQDYELCDGCNGTFKPNEIMASAQLPYYVCSDCEERMEYDNKTSEKNFRKHMNEEQ
tara:strand:+ start:1158 stop:1328 length:171 start_codon:yes stop_codon:yes gene_type:complete